MGSRMIDEAMINGKRCAMNVKPSVVASITSSIMASLKDFVVFKILFLYSLYY